MWVRCGGPNFLAAQRSRCCSGGFTHLCVLRSVVLFQFRSFQGVANDSCETYLRRQQARRREVSAERRVHVGEMWGTQFSRCGAWAELLAVAPGLSCLLFFTHLARQRVLYCCSAASLLRGLLFQLLLELRILLLRLDLLLASAEGVVWGGGKRVRCGPVHERRKSSSTGTSSRAAATYRAMCVKKIKRKKKNQQSTPSVSTRLYLLHEHTSQPGDDESCE